MTKMHDIDIKKNHINADSFSYSSSLFNGLLSAKIVLNISFGWNIKSAKFENYEQEIIFKQYNKYFFYNNELFKIILQCLQMLWIPIFLTIILKLIIFYLLHIPK